MHDAYAIIVLIRNFKSFLVTCKRDFPSFTSIAPASSQSVLNLINTNA